jgi:formate dehydrogenase iron-sulfur subunit
MKTRKRDLALLVDVTLCVGCGECVVACQEANGQPPHEATRLDARTFTYLMKRGEELHVRRLCMHCEDPSCASVCPVGAMKKTAAGPVTYDPDRCMGCRYCLIACPFDVPTYEWNARVPRVRKCEMCASSNARRGGKGPACAEACPEEATLFGAKKELIAVARRRMKEAPGRYFPHLYGIEEAGGTRVVVIGPKSPAELGLPPEVLKHPLPELTWHALEHVPDVVLFGSVILGGLYWLTNRREKVRRHEDENNESSKETDGDD